VTKTIITLVAAAFIGFSAVSVAQDAARLDEDAVAAGARDAAAEEARARQEFRELDEDVQALKKEVLDLNRDLFMLEEELLFPANSQVAFFVSMDVGEYFEIDAVQLTIDGTEVSNHLYTAREADALARGGVHRLHLANLKTGSHEVVATFIGRGPNIRDYRRGATVKFDKGIGAKYFELEITDRVIKQQPEFVIKEWE
jgi:uncharacterized membrane protein